MRKHVLMQKGFTIIELLIAVSIIAIGSSLILVLTNREINRERINSATIGLVGWIEESRRTALNGAQCTVVIKAGTHSYSPVPSLGLIATSQPVVSSTTLSPVTDCQPSNSGYKLPSTIGGSKVKIDTGAEISFSTLGTLYSPTANYGPREIILTLVAPSGKHELSRCIKISGLMGLIEIGNRNSGTCNYEARF